MNSKPTQKIFKRAAVDRLRLELRSGKSLKDYFEEEPLLNADDLLVSTIAIPDKPLVLKAPPKDPVSADLENAIALHEYYPNLDEVQASDPRLWVYLGHVQFRKYALVRWGLPGSFKDLKSPEDKEKGIKQLLEHWFVSGNDRDLRRHAIARLWWAAHLTRSPWEHDPVYFADLKNEDPYKFTRVLLLTQDIYQQVLERAMGRSDRVLISTLEFLGDNKTFAQSREKVRSLMKEMNLAYGTKKIIALDRTSLKALIERVAGEIDKAAGAHDISEKDSG
jgi:hypothetical protein